MYSDEDADKIMSDEELINEIYRNYKKAVDNDDSWCYMMRSAITTAVADKGYSYITVDED